MSQSDSADAPCLKFYFLYNPNMLGVFQLSMSICTCICPSALVVAAGMATIVKEKCARWRHFQVC